MSTIEGGERQFRIWDFCLLKFGFGILEPFEIWIWDFLVFEIWILNIEIRIFDLTF